MAAMKRDVNLGLLLLIVAALIMFSGFTVYYQTTFKNVSRTYELKLKELMSVSSELESKRSQLNETSIQLQLRKQKEEDLSKKFTDVRSDRDQLEADKKRLELDLVTTKSSLAATSAKLDQVQVQLSNTITSLTEERQKRINAESDATRLRRDVDDLKKRIACLKSNGGTSETC